MVSTFILLAIWGQSNQIGRDGLEVGPGKQFARIEDAVAKAKSGETIWVYPSQSGYPKTAIRIQTPSLKIIGADKKPVEIRGDGYEYSGSGPVPRAIFQIDPGGSGTTIQNLNLSGAHNLSFNGAGVRIQAANDVAVINCTIHDNDMGIMSNGKEGDAKAGSNQRIEYCLIERNGNLKDPGYNHNLYLGGTSVFLEHCEIRNSTTGHNVKSRAHYIQIMGCNIHDAANREIDLPEAWDTTRANSNAVLIGNRIVKDPACAGNRGVIHFGQEKGVRNGDIYLFLNTIVTPFASPVLLLTSKGVTVTADGNIFLNVEQGKCALWECTGKYLTVSTQNNLVSSGYGQLGGSNQTGVKRSEMFGLVAPDYARQWILGTSVSWVDGEGNAMKMTVGSEVFAKVGPRLGRF